MPALWSHYDYVMAATPTAASARGDAVLCQPGENNVTAVHSYSSSSLPASLTHALPILGSANSVNSKIIGA